MSDPKSKISSAHMIVQGAPGVNERPFMQLEVQKLNMDPRLRDEAKRTAELWLRKCGILIGLKFEDLLKDQEPGFYEGMNDKEKRHWENHYSHERANVKFRDLFQGWLSALQATNALNGAESITANLDEVQVRELIGLLSEFKAMAADPGKAEIAERAAEKILAIAGGGGA